MKKYLLGCFLVLTVLVLISKNDGITELQLRENITFALREAIDVVREDFSGVNTTLTDLTKSRTYSDIMMDLVEEAIFLVRVSFVAFLDIVINFVYNVENSFFIICIFFYIIISLLYQPILYTILIAFKILQLFWRLLKKIYSKLKPLLPKNKRS